MPERVRLYITKWAVANGIQVYEGWEVGKDMVKWRSNGWDHYAHKGEWFLTEAEALADAKRRVARKIASLQKQIAKLENSAIKLEDNTGDVQNAA